MDTLGLVVSIINALFAPRELVAPGGGSHLIYILPPVSPLDLCFVKCPSIILSYNLFHFIISFVKTIVRLEIFSDGFNVIKYSFLMAFNQRFEFSYSNNTLNDNNLASKINHQSNRQFLLNNH